MERSKRLVPKCYRLASLLALASVLFTLSACAGYTFDPSRVDFSGLNREAQSWGGSNLNSRPQQSQYNCESRPIYGAFGEFIRTDTVCK